MGAEFPWYKSFIYMGAYGFQTPNFHCNELVIHWSALLVIRSQIWIKISIDGVLVVEHWVNGPWAPPGLDVGQGGHLMTKMLMLAWQIFNISDLRWLLARGGRHEFEETTMKDDKNYMFNFAYISVLVDISTLWTTGGLSQIFFSEQQLITSIWKLKVMLICWLITLW